MCSPCASAPVIWRLWWGVQAAYRIFFPEIVQQTPQEEGRNRLRMILVADRRAELTRLYHLRPASP